MRLYGVPNIVWNSARFSPSLVGNVTAPLFASFAVENRGKCQIKSTRIITKKMLLKQISHREFDKAQRPAGSPVRTAILEHTLRN